MKKKYSVLVMSAGSGTRMKSNIPKQYMMVGNKMVINYSLDTFEKNDVVAEVVIVCSEADIGMVREQVIAGHGYTKIIAVVAGGKERYESVYNGMAALKERGTDYVMIHDAARPFVNDIIIERLSRAVINDKACIPAVRSKDTIRISDDNGYVKMTPKRDNVWNAQTPQIFAFNELMNAYDVYMNGDYQYGMVTDDAMIWEKVTGASVRIVEGDYNNIKITTPEDVAIAESIVRNNW